MSTAELDAVIDTKEASTILDWDYQRVCKAARKGVIARKIGGIYFYPRSEVERLAEALKTVRELTDIKI